MRKKKPPMVSTSLRLPYDLRTDIGEIAKRRGKYQDELMRIWIETGVLSEKKMNRKR